MDMPPPQKDMSTSTILSPPETPTIRIRLKTKKRKAACWQQADEYEKINEKDEVISTFARCHHCKSDFACDSKKHGNNGIANHVKRCKLNPNFASMTDSSQPILTQSSMNNALGTHIFSQKRLEDRVVEFVIRDEMPFRVVEGAGFIVMMKEAQPKFKIPNRKKIATRVWDLFLKERDKIKSAIIDQRITSHKGDDIGKVLEACLNGWGIDKIFTITVDNASANDKAVEYMNKRLDEMGTLLIDGKYLHLRCSCHIINLIVKSGLKFLGKSVESIRNCVKYIHSSPSRLDQFRNFGILLKMDKMSTVPLDVTTRWNSTYIMLSVAHKFKKVFGRMTENEQFKGYFMELVGSEKEVNKVKRVGPPSDDDWDKVLIFVQFLKRFYDTTLVLSASKTVTSTLILDEVVAIGASINEALLDTTNEKLQEVAMHMEKKFKKYWGDLANVNKLVFLGHVLDPCYKFQMIRLHLGDMSLDVTKIDEFVKELKDCLVELYNAYKGRSSSEPLGGDLDGEVDNFVEKFKDDPIKLKKHLLMMRQLRSQNQVEITNEIDKYLADSVVKWTTKFSLLEWWKGHAMAFPILSTIAKDIFAIPSSTVASENAFSLGRRVVDPFRASLHPKMVESLVCTSDWLRGEQISI